ncbi:MAG: GTPase [Planctomycetota bacterium]
MGSPGSEGASVRRLTPPGAAGVAVLAVEGDRPLERLEQLFSRGLPGPGEIAYGELRAGATSEGALETLDEVLVVRLPGASAVEVHLHGSPALVADVLERLSAGETRDVPLTSLRFAERALASVPTCPSLVGARILLDQAHGAMDREIASLRVLDEPARAARLAELVRAGRQRARLFRESVVALVGPVNAGKSTLFNALVGARAASVSADEGTTRDVLSERVRLGPWPIRLLDTAGERDLSQALEDGDPRARVESEGQQLGAVLAARADWTLRLAPAPAQMTPRRSAGAVYEVFTRCAEAFGADPADWPAGGISALEAPDHARGAIADGFARAFGLPEAEELRRSASALPFDAASVQILEAAALSTPVSDAVLDALEQDL